MSYRASLFLLTLREQRTRFFADVYEPDGLFAGAARFLFDDRQNAFYPIADLVDGHGQRLPTLAG